MRVKKSHPYVCAKSSGANRRPEKKSLVWSRAINTMTRPRSTSTETRRGACIATTDDFVLMFAASGERTAVTMPCDSAPQAIVHSSFHRNDETFCSCLRDVKKL